MNNMKVSKRITFKEDNDVIFKPFHDTFRKIFFGLTIGLMYPNPATEKLRLKYIMLIMLLSLPISLMILIDMYKCWQESDIFNIIRHSTILGPFLGALLKIILMYYKRVQAKYIIDEINEDYESYNRLPMELQQVALQSIKNNVFYVEKLWPYVVSTGTLTFPIIGATFTLLSYLTQEEPKKYMVHDLNLPFRPADERFESPYFECMFVYMVWAALICIFNYISYDGFFGMACLHACLKMRLYCKKLELTFRSDDDNKYSHLVKVIEEQQKMFRYVALIQDTFNIWLGTIVVCTIIQIGSLLYHVSAGYGFDFRYALFSCTSVVHIFLPCTYAATLKNMSTTTSDLIYCSGWEYVGERRLRRVLPFILARAQIPCRITAFYMFEIDMALFVQMMRTSYTIFTLLRS